MISKVLEDIIIETFLIYKNSNIRTSGEFDELEKERGNLGKAAYEAYCGRKKLLRTIGPVFY